MLLNVLLGKFETCVLVTSTKTQSNTIMFKKTQTTSGHKTVVSFLRCAPHFFRTDMENPPGLEIHGPSSDLAVVASLQRRLKPQLAAEGLREEVGGMGAT